jgi:two-component system, cell cycle response regulator
VVLNDFAHNPANRATDKPLILLIHQEAGVLRRCQEQLEAQGFHVDTANDGSEGIRKAYLSIPDAIVVGAAVSDLNGYQVTRLLKNDPVMRKIPILLVAEVSRKMERFWGMKAGVDDFIPQNELEATLLKRLNGILDIYGQIDLNEKRLLQANNAKNPFNIRARINQILDISLVESMLMVEFRGMADLVHDTSLLNYMLFSLLESLLEYSAAAILYQDAGKTPRIVTVHLPEGKTQPSSALEILTDSFFYRLKEKGMTDAQLEMTRSEIIGTIDDQGSAIPYQTTYTKDFFFEGKLLGSFVLYSEKVVDYSRIFPLHLIEEEIRLLMKLRHLYSRAESFAVSDSLTGLCNQNHFMNQLQHECKSAVRYEQDLTLALMSLDSLKHINEIAGQSAGDNALKQFATLLEASLRGVDIVARLTGKMFAVLMPSTALEQAVLAIQRLQNTTSKIDFSTEGHKFPLSFSVGLTAVDSNEKDSAASLMTHAQQALQRARQNGQNQIEIS